MPRVHIEMAGRGQCDVGFELLHAGPYLARLSYYIMSCSVGGEYPISGESPWHAETAAFVCGKPVMETGRALPR